MSNVTAEFVDFAALEAGWSIGRTTAYDLIRQGKIRSITLRREGNLRGKRLVEVASVRQLLAACPTDIDPKLSAQLRKTRQGEKSVRTRKPNA